MTESQPYPALPHQRHSEAPEVLPAMFDQQYPPPSSLFWCQCNRTHSRRIQLTAVAAELLRSKRRRRCFRCRTRLHLSVYYSNAVQSDWEVWAPQRAAISDGHPAMLWTSVVG